MDTDHNHLPIAMGSTVHTETRGEFGRSSNTPAAKPTEFGRIQTQKREVIKKIKLRSVDG
jgi:hypothetical protein